MNGFLQFGLVVIAGASVAIADGLIKQSAFKTHDFWVAMKNPFMIVAVILYLLQIVLFSYVFVKRWELGVVGLMQMVVYAVIVILLGILFFNEKITLIQGYGMFLALTGVLLMNL